MARLTVKDLMDQRGKHQFAMLRVETLEEAEAAAQAGVELLSVPPAMILDGRFRDAAPDCFAFPGDNFYEIGGTDDFLRWAFPLYKHGADGFYCSGSLATVRALAEHALPVCGHVGLIPSKCTWTGGFKAVARRWRRRSWCGTSARLWKPQGFRGGNRSGPVFDHSLDCRADQPVPDLDGGGGCGTCAVSVH